MSPLKGIPAVISERYENSAEAIKVTRENDESDDQKRDDGKAIRKMVDDAENEDALNLPAEKPTEEEDDAANEYDASAPYKYKFEDYVKKSVKHVYEEEVMSAVKHAVEYSKTFPQPLCHPL